LRPAFRTDLHAAAFLFLVVAALAAPVLLDRIHHPSREYVYQVMREQDGAFSFVQHEIFDVKEDIDILFAGNSTVWAGMDSPLMEEALTRRRGRKAHVVSFGSYWPSVDVPYMEIVDALAHKRIHMVVISVPRMEYGDAPSPVAARFLSYGDPPEAREGLPARYRLTLYAGFVLRSPRDVLASLRPTRSIPSAYTANNGSLLSTEGWEKLPFTVFSPPPPEVPAGESIYSAQTGDRFAFIQDPLPFYQTWNLRKLTGLLAARKIKMVMVGIPQYPERRNGRVVERQPWQEILGPQVAVAGIPPAVLFSGITDENIRKLYFDNMHLNRNGSEFLTRALTPALLELYAGDSQIR
jgi:hypothetical protein